MRSTYVLLVYEFEICHTYRSLQDPVRVIVGTFCYDPTVSPSFPFDFAKKKGTRQRKPHENREDL